MRAARSVFLITALGSVLVVNLQLRLMDVAGEAQTLGAAMNHASLNIANALGAWLGGLVIAAGYGYRSPAAGRRGAVGRRLGVLLWSAHRAPPRAAADSVGQHVVERHVHAAVADPRAEPLDAVLREAVGLDHPA